MKFDLENRVPVVFAYWHQGELKGFRADTFGNISKNRPKIYGYSPEQVQTVLDNTRDTINYANSKFFESLYKHGYSDQEFHTDVMTTVNETEDSLRNWGSFELRIHPFIDYDFSDEWFNYPEQYLVDIEIKNLRPAVEIHRFSIIQNEN